MNRMRVQLERLLAHQATARSLYSTVHDLTGLAHDLHARESTFGESHRRRDPILRLQACGLAMRLRERLEQSLHALEVEERGGQGCMTPGRWSQSGSIDMVTFLCKGTDAAKKFFLLASYSLQAEPSQGRLRADSRDLCAGNTIEQDKAIRQVGLILVCIASKLCEKDQVFSRITPFPHADVLSFL
jgi:hypothetical protein